MPSMLQSPLTIFGISKGKFQRLQKSSLYLLGRFQEKYQRAKNNSVQIGQKLKSQLRHKLCRSQKSTSAQLAEKSDFNFCTGCVEVEVASRQKARH